MSDEIRTLLKQLKAETMFPLLENICSTKGHLSSNLSQLQILKFFQINCQIINYKQISVYITNLWLWSCTLNSHGLLVSLSFRIQMEFDQRRMGHHKHQNQLRVLAQQRKIRFVKAPEKLC